MLNKHLCCVVTGALALACLCCRAHAQDQGPTTVAPAKAAPANAALANAAPATRGVVYGHAGDQDLQLDVYGAPGALQPGAPPVARKPAMICVHGGAWVTGSRADMSAPANFFAQNGYVAFAVSYRLLKGEANRYPAQIDDVQRAVRWVRAHADEYGVNPTQIGAFGISAGGHLVGLLGTMDTRDNSAPELAKYSSRVQCVIEVSGPMNLLSMSDAKVLDIRQRREALARLVELLGPLPADAQKYRDASPLFHIDKKTAPCLLFHGGQDALVPIEQAQEMEVALREAGIASKLVVFPDAGHVPGDTKAVETQCAESLAFLRRYLKP